MKFILSLLLIVLFIAGCMVFKNSETCSAEKEKRKEATRLYQKALKLEEEKDYRAARECYKQSLELQESKKVSKAYLRLLSAMGPM